jgi:hypothetical protein
MSRRHLIYLVVALSALAVGVRAAETTGGLAERAAGSWLSWSIRRSTKTRGLQAAKLFKGAVTKEQWQQCGCGRSQAPW